MAISLAWWPEHPDLRPWRGSDYWLPASLCFDVPGGELARTGVAIRNVEPDASSRRASRAPRAGLACLWRGPGARRRSEALSGLAAATLGQAGPPVGRQRCRRGLHGGRRSAATYPRGTDRRCWGSCRHGRLRPPVPPQPCARQERPCAPVAPAQYFAGAVERDSLPRGTAEVYDSLLAHLEVGFASVPTTPYHPNSGAPRATGWGSRTAPTAGYRPGAVLSGKGHGSRPRLARWTAGGSTDSSPAWLWPAATGGRGSDPI